MGLFNIFYSNKPGKGVEKDEPEKHAFFQFWTLFGRRFGRMVLLNILFFIIVSPLLTVGYLYANDFFGIVTLTAPSGETAISERPAGETQEQADEQTEAEELRLPPFGLILISIFIESIPRPVFFGLVIFSAVLLGPVMCGYTYILRNYARREHAWISDFWTRMRANLLQGIQMGTIEILFLVLFFASLSATSAENLMDVEGSMRIVLYICRYASFGIALIWLFMRSYFYVMIVTFNLKIGEILKNAFIFAVLGLPRNIIALLSQIAFIVISILALWFMGEFIEFLYTATLMLSLCGFVSVFSTYPVIRKYLIDPLNKQKEEALEQ